MFFSVSGKRVGIVIVTGANGLVGSECVAYFSRRGFHVVGIDNDMRATFFGKAASTAWRRLSLVEEFPSYKPVAVDIRDRDGIDRIFAEYSSSIDLVIHAAAQPSHDWAAREPATDFSVNATGTLNLLEAARRFAAGATFIFTSTNKVYGDRPNELPLVETESRWEIAPGHKFHNGIDESMSLDQTTHSLFGVSKVAADLMVQEYGRYFGMKTGVFRGGCLTGPAHSGTELHGFLAYLIKCVVQGIPYQVFGYQGKQVRDNIHSCDLASAFFHFFENPRPGEVYNMGGGRHCNCSVLEAIELAEQVTGRTLRWRYMDENRKGDHKWWISDVSKFRSHYPGWAYAYSLREIIEQLCAFQESRVEAMVEVQP